MMKRRGRYCGSSLERHGAHINECLFVYLPSAQSPFNHDHSIFHPPPSYIPHARPAKRKSRLVTYALRCRSLSPSCIIFFRRVFCSSERHRSNGAHAVRQRVRLDPLYLVVVG